MANGLAREKTETGELRKANAALMRQRQQGLLVSQKVKTELEKTNLLKIKAQRETLRLRKEQEALNKTTKTTTNSLIQYGRAFVGITGGVLIVRRLTETADAYTLLQNKLTLVSDSQEQVNELTREMFEISGRTFANVEDTAKAFQRFDLALTQLGASQKETLRLTETVNKSLILSGANTGEQSAALLQLSQAFNKGKLDGDEFRSVMELMPPIADAIAKQLGVTRGELLKLAPEGKITAEVMRQAFAKAADEIDRNFSQVVPTISQSMTVLKNEFTAFFGEVNTLTGASNGLSESISDLSQSLNGVNRLLALIPNNSEETENKFLKGLKTAYQYSTGLGVLRAQLERTGTAFDKIADGAEQIAGSQSELRKETEAGELAWQNYLKESAQVDAVFADFNRKLGEQRRIYTAIGDDVQVYRQEQKFLNELRKSGVEITTQSLQTYSEEIEIIRDLVREQERERAVMSELNGLYDQTAGRAQNFADKMQAIRLAMAGGVEGFDKDDALTALSGETGGFLTTSPEMMNAEIAELQTFYGRIDQMRQANLISEQSASSAKMQIWLAEQNVRLRQAENFFGYMAVLQNTESKKMQRIGKAAAIAGALIDTYKAATGAYSAMASIPYVGPALGASAAGAAIAACMAQVNQIRSVGNYATSGIVPGTSFSGDSLTANVNSDEMILNKTQQANLFRLANSSGFVNNSASVGKTATGNASAVNITVENYGSSEIEVRQIDENNIRIIAREESRRVVREEAPGVIAQDLANANSLTSKSLSQNTTTERRR